MSENWGIAVFSVLLGAIFYEIRAIRAELKGCVADKMCKIMMSDHEDRLKKLEEK